MGVAERTDIFSKDGRRFFPKDSAGVISAPLEYSDGEDTVNILRYYLNEIGQVGLLTKEKESELFAKVFLGRLAYTTLFLMVNANFLEACLANVIKSEIGGVEYQRLGVFFSQKKKKGKINRSQYLEVDRTDFEESIKKSKEDPTNEQILEGYVIWIRNRIREGMLLENKGIASESVHKLLNGQINLAKRALQTSRVIDNCNLRFVVNITKKWAGGGLELVDLIQEGNIGLMRAIDRFDPLMGNRLSTYAEWWINQAVNRFITDKARSIHIPQHIHQMLALIDKIEKEFVQKYQREPTLSEKIQIATKRGIKVTEEEYEKIIAVKSVVSLETSVGEEGSELGDFIEDPNQDLDEIAYRIFETKSIDEVLGVLTTQERKVIDLRFGLRDDKMRTLDVVGETIGVSRETVRKIQIRALKKLKQPSVKNKLMRVLYKNG